MTTNGEGTVSVTRRIEAPAHEIFTRLTDPAGHPSFDGSGMLRDGAGNTTIAGVGDTFLMKMHNEMNGDYTMRNHVVEFVLDQRLVWEPSRADVEGEGPAGHQWGYELVPDGASSTVVTEFFDCSRAPQWLRDIIDDGSVWREAMTTSLEQLAMRCAHAE
jgi:uncharacterized protein YndB with AHSA1/START domain